VLSVGPDIQVEHEVVPNAPLYLEGCVGLGVVVPGTDLTTSTLPMLWRT